MNAEPLPTPHLGTTPLGDLAERYDVVVIGGAVAGAGTALVLRRLHPEARILIVEALDAFPRKVGEATAEVSGYFLEQVLEQKRTLTQDHLPKHGLRFWFTDGEASKLEDMTEIGGVGEAKVPAYQLDRSRIDEDVLATAEAAGCDVARPAKVTAWEEGWPESRVTLQPTGDGAGEAIPSERQVRCRWVVDASGRRAFVARRKQLLDRIEEHPTAAMWSRWDGVVDLDDPDFLRRDTAGGRDRLPPTGTARRRLATNHFCGYGWWSWMIPLADGSTSIGLVYDKQLFQPPGTGSAEERYRDFLTTWPGLDELLADATPVTGDFNAYRHLPYLARQYMAPGWALVGDAAAFLDPFYSPGLDHVAMSAYATARLLAADLSGELGRQGDRALEERIDLHNERFQRSYGRWLRALYQGKYEIFGDAELTACAYLVDTALYYLGIVHPVYKDRESLANPTFGLEIRSATLAYRLMHLFNRRLNHIARYRRASGRYGRKNAGWRKLGRPPGLGADVVPMLVSGFALWLRLEVRHLWLRRVVDRLRPGRSARRRVDLSEPVPAP